MHLLLTNIEWDTDGVDLDACNLPSTVVVLDCPEVVADPDVFANEDVADALSEAFGFLHHGFQWERLNKAHDTHAGGGYLPTNLGLIRSPS